MLSKNHPVKTLAQLRKHNKTVTFAATGPGSGSYQRAILLQMDGFPVKPITGYISTPERMLAVIRGDTDGTSNSYESTASAIKEHGMVPIAYLGNAHPAFKAALADPALLAEAKKAKLVKHEGPVTKIKRGGCRVWINYKDKEVVARISGSRTKVTLAGKKAKRKAIKVGIKCRFTYPKPGKEATNVDCRLV